MSAYIVSDATIHYLLLYMRYQVSKKQQDQLLQSYWPKDITDNDEMRLLGQKLVDKNYASVNYRYNENDLPYCYQRPSPESRIAKKLQTAIETNPVFAAVQFIKAVRCLDYQCCETPGYERTDFAVMLHDWQVEASLIAIESKTPDMVRQWLRTEGRDYEETWIENKICHSPLYDRASWGIDD